MADTSTEIARRQVALVSIVVPVFNESGNIETLAGSIAEAMKGFRYELVLVDDGSDDDTLATIERLVAADGRVRGISFARNFGHQCALAAGLRYARGQVVIMMDGDMQHPPSLLPVLIAKWREGFNVVQTKREDPVSVPRLKRVTSGAFYKVFGALCGVRLDPGMADFRLLDRMVVDELNQMQEGQLFLRGLVAWMGHRTAVVPFKVGERHAGTSKYTVRKMFHLARSAVFSFSSIPLRIGIAIGFVTALVSFLELLYIFIAYIITDTVPGWASTLGVTALLFGVLFLLVGIQGEYILRIYERVQRRPPFLVERVVERKQGEEPGPGTPQP